MKGISGRASKSAVTTAAVIVAAGQGRRMSEVGGQPPVLGRTPTRAKQFLLLAGRPILSHTLDRFEASPVIGEIVLVVPRGEETHCTEEIVRPGGFHKIKRIIAGGDERQESVAFGLAAVSETMDLVAVHDGVRPCVTSEQIAAVCAAAAAADGAVLAIPLQDTPKQVGEGQVITQTLRRQGLWLAQTPQVFHRKILQEAYARAALEGVSGTDDAALVERLGARICVVLGASSNIKITTSEDLPLAERWLEMAGHLP